MADRSGHEHPYAAIDLPQLDRGFLSLLAYAAEGGRDRHEGTGQGLRIGEKLLFRFGIFVGQAEWELASQTVDSLIQNSVLSGAEVECAAAEAVMIKGVSACVHLGPALQAHGLRGPASVAEGVERAQAVAGIPTTSGSGESGLTEREVFALGLGVTWGARCWDT